MHVVEFLLENGANPNACMLVTGRKTTLIATLEINKGIVNGRDPNRFNQISALLKKHGAD